MTLSSNIEKIITKELGFDVKFANSLGAIILVVSADQKIQFINPMGSHLTGYDSQEIQDQNLFDLLMKKDENPKIIQLFQQRQGRFEGPITIRSKSGNDIYLQGTSLSALSDTGNLENIAIIGYDVSERYRAQQALKESQRKYSKLFNNSPLLMAYLDTKGQVIEANSKFIDIFGNDQQNPLNLFQYLKLSPKDQAALITGETTQLRYHHASSTIPEIQGSIPPITIGVSIYPGEIDAQGSPTEFLFQGTNLTKVVSLEEQTYSAQILLNQILDTSQVIIMVQDLHGKIIQTNRYFEDLIGYTTEEIIGKYPWNLFETEADQGSYQELVKKLAANRKTSFGQSKINTKTRKSVVIAWADSYLPGKEISNSRILSIGIDLTQYHDLSLALEQAESSLKGFIGSASSGIYILDKDLNFVEVNDTVLTGINRRREDVIGQNLANIFPLVIKNGSDKKLREVIKTGIPYYNDNVPRDPNYGDGFVNLRFFKVKDGVCVITNNITERVRMEQALEHDSAFIGAVLDTSDAIIVVYDAEGRFVRVNPSAEKMLGSSSEELKGKFSWDMGPPDEKAKNKSIFMDMVAGKKTLDKETRILTKSGDDRIVSRTNTRLFDAQGNVEYVISTGIDITERVHAIQAVQEERDLVNVIIQIAGSLVIITDREGRITEFNDVAELITGYTRNEAIGQVLVDLITTPENRSSALEMFEAAKRDYAIRNYELTLTTKNGEPRIIAASDTILYSDSGEVNYSILTGIDISERKYAEEQNRLTRKYLAKKVAEKTQNISEQKQRIEFILDSINDGVLVLDQSGNIHLTNATFRTYYQRILDEPFPKNMSNIEQFQTGSPFIQAIHRLNESPDSMQLTIEAQKGFHLKLESDGYQIGNDPDSFVKVIEFYDISPFVALDNRRRQFISTASHELRTPTTVILSSLTNLMQYRDRLTEDQISHIFGSTFRNAKAMSKIIEDLLLVSKIDDRSLKLEMISYTLTEIITLVLGELENLIQEKQILIDKKIPTTIRLYGDITSLKRVFSNIIHNALTYSTTQKTVTISVQDHYKGEYNPTNQDGVLVSISDQGRGIKNEELPYLFDRFYRAEDGTTKSGAGLGLSIAKQLVLQHKGEIYATSEYGKGSTFSIFLPQLQNEPKVQHPE